ncbi:hypothetical protein KIH23_00135 [Flavobacterium sp. CYK-55]|uniref:hypothetical protein n=1 Tax=Flavobacterium sp. CYK-55 TaxID=2835529 RepID=UPI001BCC4E32|nr:hypothetical protein [Flavobacterium sp. CYK-55]MBS7785689.1 hypothetical protein [Flavobacterium sp. CYK-55]
MKKYINNKISKVFLTLSCFGIFIACQEDDVFSGQPQGPFTTLKGSVTTTETNVVSSQSFPITVSLGDNPETPEADLLTFPMDVSVEVIAYVYNENVDVRSSKRSRRTFIVPAGENSIVADMIAPGADGTTDLPFNMDLRLFMSAITTAPEVTPKGFPGKQYLMTSDTINVDYGDTPFAGVNSKRLGIRFDFIGPHSGAAPSSAPINNLNIVVKRNGAVMPSQSPSQGISPSSNSTRPYFGTTNNANRYESLNFLDATQTIKVYNATYADSLAGIFTVKAVSSAQAAADRPHGFKVGDEVSFKNFNGSGSAPTVVQVLAVQDAYTFKFQASNTTFGSKLAFSQPKSVAAGLSPTDVELTWSPFFAYVGGNVIKYNGVYYYCRKDIASSIVGNAFPSFDTDHWVAGQPKINWENELSAPHPTWDSRAEYFFGDVVTYNGVLFVNNGYSPSRTPQETANPNPAATNSEWSVVINSYNMDFQNYTSTDTFTIEVYAQRLGGLTSNAPATDIPYKFTVRYPDEKVKVFGGVFSGMTIGSTTNSIQKMTIMRTTVQGVSSFAITHN